MQFHNTGIEGLVVIEPEIMSDLRGEFFRTFCREEFNKQGLEFEIVQANTTITKRRGSIRGMHLQLDPMAEDKLVQCFSGKVFDVAIDLRKDSPTFGKWHGLELNEDNHKIFLIPKGFAHGFQSLENDCVMHYYMSQYYSPDHSTGVRWDDPSLGISWPLPVKDLSEKDRAWPLLDPKL